MKKHICLLLVLSILFFFVSCKSANEDIEIPISFYYCTLLAHKDSKLPVFEVEIREAAYFNSDLVRILNNYLKGPETDELLNPFPAKTEIISVSRDDENITLVLSSEFSELTGLDLSIACAAISMTLFEITQCSSVTISADNVLLDGAEHIVISSDTLYMADFITVS